MYHGIMKQNLNLKCLRTLSMTQQWLTTEQNMLTLWIITSIREFSLPASWPAYLEIFQFLLLQCQLPHWRKQFTFSTLHHGNLIIMFNVQWKCICSVIIINIKLPISWGHKDHRSKGFLDLEVRKSLKIAFWYILKIIASCILILQNKFYINNIINNK